MSDLNQTVTQQPVSPALTESGQLRRHSQELGLLGKLFGSKEHAPMNIAGFAVVVAFFCIVGVLCWMPDTAAFSRKDATLILVGIITLALGFLFGRGSAHPH
jgi:hypothetical protein